MTTTPTDSKSCLATASFISLERLYVVFRFILTHIIATECLDPLP